MSFGIIHNVVLVNREASEKVIAAGRHKWLCQDWSCPMNAWCGRHFGLSDRYAAMRDQRRNEALVVPARSGDRCRHFVIATRDYFAESMGEKRAFPNTDQAGRA